MSRSGFVNVPRATYRVQLTGSFGFADAAAIVPYLDRLGISHVYCSPYLKARPGSSHGYDIIDHNALNPELGDMAAFDAFCEALGAAGMSHILDFVPNHMGIGQSDNAWWLDVLEWGRESPYAEYFDIDWEPAKVELRGKVLVPFLGDHYGRVLENGDLVLRFDAGEGKFSVWYYDHRFPLEPAHYAPLLADALERLSDNVAAGESEGDLVAFDLLVAGFRDLRRPARSARQRTIRRSKAEKLVAQLTEVAGRDAAVREAIDAAAAAINGTPGEPASFVRLHRLLEAQHYRLAFWRVAAEEINYRRFFQINDLAGIRVELPHVFDNVHQLVIRLAAEGRLQGLRLDHIDGLFDPKQYLIRLQDKIRAARGETAGTDGASAGADGDGLFYVLVEKILAHHERVREDWPVAGTTGYDYLNRLNGVFVDPEAAESLVRSYQRFIEEARDFDEMCYHAKKQAMDEELASELRVLANEFNRLTEDAWLTRDYTLVGLRQALREIVACFPVYRTYVDRHGASPEDARDMQWAVARAERRSMRPDKSVFPFIRDVLTMSLGRGRKSPYPRREVQRLAMKFQQYTGPVMAKGVEDTAFYRFCALTSLNEVGGEPTRFGVSVSAFHNRCQDQAKRSPASMVCTATHDTKRGEDVRARINVLSEMPDAWAESVRRWAAFNRRRKVDLEEGPAPTPNHEYLFYQTLVGAWPLEFHDAEDLDPEGIADFRERMTGYMLKAVREAKTRTSWTNMDPDYEGALTAFVEQVLEVERPNPFLADFRPFHRRIAELGMLNGLAQVALKLTMPGVPDIYQGCELWDLNLVDPDNRRPVDFSRREALLSDIETRFEADPQAAATALLADWVGGGVKLLVVARLLALRRAHPAVFEEGAYLPLETEGRRAEHVLAFARANGDQRLVVCVPRLLARLTTPMAPLPIGEGVWRDTALVLPGDLAGVSWRNIFTGETLSPAGGGETAGHALASVLASFPVAALVASD
ncbi:MAG: malto-oligosyltrehalose synthase [Rhodospirillales bacterium]|nr:MAG: malto-oligosyltrehalose synthase [Rhodospirillales bacterium]